MVEWNLCDELWGKMKEKSAAVMEGKKVANSPCFVSMTFGLLGSTKKETERWRKGWHTRDLGMRF